VSITCPPWSPFDKSIPVLVIDPGDEPSRFDHTYACALFGEDIKTPIIVVDGRILSEDWFTEEHLLVILAHETGHIIARTNNEREADERGLQLIKDAGYEAAYQLYTQEYHARLMSGSYGGAA